MIFKLVIEKLGNKLPNAKCEARIKNAIQLIKTRGETINEIAELALVFISVVEPADEKAKEILAESSSIVLLKDLYAMLQECEEWRAESLKRMCNDFAAERGLKPVVIMKVLRSTVLGTFNSPPIYETMEIIQKEEVLARVLRVLSKFPALSHL